MHHSTIFQSYWEGTTTFYVLLGGSFNFPTFCSVILTREVLSNRSWTVHNIFKARIAMFSVECLHIYKSMGRSQGALTACRPNVILYKAAIVCKCLCLMCMDEKEMLPHNFYIQAKLLERHDGTIPPMHKDNILRNHNSLHHLNQLDSFAFTLKTV